MKSDLLELINRIDDIKLPFHIVGGNGMPQANGIYRVSEFVTWKKELQLELQNVYDSTRDHFIWETLTILKQGFNDLRDEVSFEVSFNELTGSLLAIKKNIDKYYPSEKLIQSSKEEGEATVLKKPKVFISHSTKDKDSALALIELLMVIGLNEQQIFCSSAVGFGIPLNEDIYEYLQKQFKSHNLHVIFMLSENYYDSVACMNEMGAAWVLQNKYTSILLPDFDFKEIGGAINPRKIAIKLPNDGSDTKEKLGQLKNTITNEFDLASTSDVRWEQKRDVFIETVLASHLK